MMISLGKPGLATNTMCNKTTLDVGYIGVELRQTGPIFKDDTEVGEGIVERGYCGSPAAKRSRGGVSCCI